MTNNNKVMAILGAGDAISYAVAELFGSKGFKIALISRSNKHLDAMVEYMKKNKIIAFPFLADVADDASVRDAFEDIYEKLGDISVLHYNVSKIKNVNILDETHDSLTKDFKINASGLLTVYHEVMSDFEALNEGTILVTGASEALNPDINYGALSASKAALRNIVINLHHALKEKNIFVGTVCVNNITNINKENIPNIANAFWQLYTDRLEFEIAV
ncbi:MAG: SDR family NAD(P)-dependent oxidoreductase [Chitinophagales bacterium]|nr:SDR family NAD(P)-dependent oxidoreductase [Chitinophagales bacterium]